jgi:hypothetical protein
VTGLGTIEGLVVLAPGDGADIVLVVEVLEITPAEQGHARDVERLKIGLVHFGGWDVGDDRILGPAVDHVVGDCAVMACL